MRIWVDGQCFQTGSNVRGIGRYVSDFLQALDRRDDQIQIIIGLNGRMKEEAVAARQYINALLPKAEVLVWYGIARDGEFQEGFSEERQTDEKILAAHINRLAPDIALSPSPFEGHGDRSVPFIKPDTVDALTACIYHDAIPYRFPDVYLKEENARKLYMRRFEEIGNFDLVLCNSQFTEDEYRDIYQRDNSVTISAGLSDSFRELVEAWQPSDRSIGHQLGRYALYVGGMDWRKNVSLLVRAMGRLGVALAGEIKLVLAGDFGEEYVAPLREMWAQRGLPPENLVATGWISDADLVDLYKNAAITLQPSRMEGFGLTAVEAWACDSPFLSASGGAVAEVIGNDSYLFDPDTPAAAAALIQRVLNDEAFREGQLEHGRERLKEFTWGKTASIAYAAMQEALLEAGREPTPPQTASMRQRADKRLVLDVSSTAQSPVLSGIQRVMYNLSEALLGQNDGQQGETVLSYCRDIEGWYKMERLTKDDLDLNPLNYLSLEEGDSYLLLDSSWTFIEGQRPRLLDALNLGQEVVNGVHDIGPLTMSAMTDSGMPPAFRRWFEFILGYSTGIICVSRAVADEIHDILVGIDFPRPMKLGYFPLGADFSNAEADFSGLEMFDSARPNFLMVGTIEPRKGHLVALKAFEKLWSEGYDVNLIIVGKAGWDTEMIVHMLENHSEAGNRLHWIKNASDGNLRAAYEKASALIMTSYLEGFGLPVVEAGRFGTPVILSDLPVFREVGEGAPWAGYFERANPLDLTRVVREFLHNPPPLSSGYAKTWPVWTESGEHVKKTILDGDWYKTYTPSKLLPNVLPSQVVELRMDDKLLHSEDRKHKMRVIEGPLLSDRSNFLRIVVALRNDSDRIWSSAGTPEGTMGLFLSYHLYDEDGTCLSFDNPRTEIPFVLLPGQEIFLPIRVPVSWLAKGVSEIGIDLVQEGVAWFENEIRMSLLEPIDNTAGTFRKRITSDFVSGENLLMSLASGPFSGGLVGENYYLISLFNNGETELCLTGESPYSISIGRLRDGHFTSSGAWITSVSKSVKPNNFAYLCFFLNTPAPEKDQIAVLRYENASAYFYWTINLESRTVAFLSRVEKSQTELERPLATDLTAERAKDAAPQEFESVRYDLHLNSTKLPPLRGFHPPEEGHIWMSDTSGEMQISQEISERDAINTVVIYCKSPTSNEAPVELHLVIGREKTSAKLISSEEFMYYTFTLTKKMSLALKTTKIIRFQTNKAVYLPGDERLLSIAFVSISLSHESSVALVE
jgi:glycosyltransferase involved in cell wall biosynthesis